MNGRASTYPAFDRELAADLLREAIHLREPETGASLSLGCEEWLHGVPPDLLRHAFAGVDNRHADELSVAKVRRQSPFAITRAAGLDRDAAVPLDGVSCTDEINPPGDLTKSATRWRG